MRKHTTLLGIALLATAGAAMAADAGKHGAWEPLLDARLSKFDVYLSYRGDEIMSVLEGTAPATLKPIGLNPAGQSVFSVVQREGKAVLRITGEIYGCLVTKQDYSNYRFRAQVRWGEKKWQPRLAELKDSGILYHSRGEPGVDYWKSWMLSQEFQVMEHGMGEFWPQATSAIDIRVGPKERSPRRKSGRAEMESRGALAGIRRRRRGWQPRAGGQRRIPCGAVEPARAGVPRR
jgi:hypothetical protein